MLHPISLKFPQWCLCNSSNTGLIDDGPFLSFPGRLSSAGSLYPLSFRWLMVQCLSPSGGWWCSVFGFVPKDNVQSSKTLLIFRDASHLWWLLCLPVYPLGRFPWFRHVQDNISNSRRAELGLFVSVLTQLCHGEPTTSTRVPEQIKRDSSV